MRKNLGFVFCCFLFCSLLIVNSAFSITGYSPPAFSGGRGLLRVLSARTQGKGMLGTSLHGEWSLINYKGNDPAKFPFYQGDTTNQKPDAHHFGKIHFGINYAVNDYFEANTTLNLKGYADNKSKANVRWDNDNFNESFINIDNIEIVLKGSYPSKEYGTSQMSYAVGLAPFIKLAPMSRNSGYSQSGTQGDSADQKMVAHGFPAHIKHAPDFGGLLLFDFAVKPVQTHFNLGYQVSGDPQEGVYVPRPNPDTTPGRPRFLATRIDTFKRYDQFLWGWGLESALGPWVTFFMEGSGGMNMNAPDNVEDLASVGGGVRFNTPAGVTVDLGYEKVLTGTQIGIPDWWFLFGLSVTANVLPKPKPKPQGIIAGRVRAADTDKPLLNADIALPDYEKLKVTIDSLGGFRVIVNPGANRIRVAAGDSFISQEKTVNVEDQGSVFLDFALQRKYFPKGNLVGKVTDAKTGDALGATITFGEAKDVKPITTDPTNGIFKGELPPGIYTATCSATDYNPKTLPVTIKDKETTLQNFELSPKWKTGQKFVLKGVFFDRRGNVLPESRVALEELSKAMKENSTAKIEIGGHTDSRGSARRKQRISENRANAVRNYLISMLAIPAERITARGYGGTLPIDTNMTKAGRQANNRIEVLVTSTAK